jgi:hypothetical protein
MPTREHQKSKILDFVKSHKNLTEVEIASALSLPFIDTIEILEELQAEGKLKSEKV